MNTQTFSNTRQQASAAVMALSLTLGMLFSVNQLATSPANDLPMAANSASNAKMVSHTARTPQG